MSQEESGNNFAKVAATSLILDVTRGSSDTYLYHDTLSIAPGI